MSADNLPELVAEVERSGRLGVTAAANLKRWTGSEAFASQRQAITDLLSARTAKESSGVERGPLKRSARIPLPAATEAATSAKRRELRLVS